MKKSNALSPGIRYLYATCWCFWNYHMLSLKCAACKKKIWKYHKVGPGEVLRCHKGRIVKMYQPMDLKGKVSCPLKFSFACEMSK